ncbi:MAG TPA: TOBE domain-containing protein [Chitinivibrionales bacterium]|nr:TOBE domain-containing protein [Chitinivibrionales bacterium]
MENHSPYSGPLWLLFGGRHLLEKNALELLKSIDRLGSITSAAREVGISYKTAWDLVDRLNNLSSKPLVASSTGGRHGGGCRLSDYGKKILDEYNHHKEQFEVFKKTLSGKENDFALFTDFTRSLILKTSARNQFSGVVEKIVPGPVSTEVVLRISETDAITAVITSESAKILGLEKGGRAIALVKAPSIIIMIDDGKTKTSAMNRLCGKVSGITRGAVNNEIKIALDGSRTIVATITKQSSEAMKLSPGSNVCAVFNASQVILAVTE